MISWCVWSYPLWCLVRRVMQRDLHLVDGQITKYYMYATGLETIPATFFWPFFFLWSFWSSSTLPRLVCLAYVRGFYFLFCCVEVSSVVLCCVCCVALCCNPLCCVALRCVAIRCVVSVLLHCVVLYLLSCIPLCWVVLRCLVLCCVVDKFSISSIPSVLKLCCALVDILNQPHSLADNLYTRELDKLLNHPYQIEKLNIFHLL